MNIPLATKYAWQLLDNEDEGLYGFTLWFVNRFWYYYCKNYIVNTLALIGLISIYFFIIKLYRKNKALNLRLNRVERDIKNE
jgi:hypothetical protein